MRNVVTAVTPLPGYKIHVVFSDGLEGDYSMKRFINLGGVFKKMRDEKFFRRVFVSDGGAVCWPPEIDFAPDVMHDEIGKRSGKRFRPWVPVIRVKVKGKWKWIKRRRPTTPRSARARLRWLAERGDPVALSLITAPPEDEIITTKEEEATLRARAGRRTDRRRVVKVSPMRPRLPQFLRVELDRETDGRWIADIGALPGVLLYGATAVDAVRDCAALALEVLAGELRHGDRTVASIPMFRTVLPRTQRPKRSARKK